MNYMPSLTEFLNDEGEEWEPNIDGAFDCQTCNECVESALLDFTKGVLIWKCSKGHLSYVENFNV